MQSERLIYLAVRKHHLEHEIFLLLSERASAAYERISLLYQDKLSDQQCEHCAKKIFHVFDKAVAFHMAKEAADIDLSDKEFSTYWPRIWEAAVELRKTVRYEGPDLSE